ncbi:MAG: flagellar motor switch protein FliM [Candidatus Manganitrophaceae bacterium]
MAEKILSQDEVDALLKGLGGGKVDVQQPAQPVSGIRSYDLTTQDRIIRGRMPSLEIINERFGRFFQVSVSSTLRREVEFTPVSVEIVKFGEFMRKIPLPSSISVVKMDPLRGYVLLVIDSAVIYRWIDLLFGGSGQTHVKIEGRDFTQIEQRVIRKIVDLLLQDLQKAWTPVIPVKITLARSEINPQFAMIVAPTEVAVIACFKLEMDGQGKEIFLCLPYPTIEPVREKLYGGFQSDQLEVDRQWTERFKDQLTGTFVSVGIELGAAMLTVREVINLAVGDVITLDRGTDDFLEMAVEGSPKFYGRPGVHHGNRAFQVVGVLDEAKKVGLTNRT